MTNLIDDKFPEYMEHYSYFTTLKKNNDQEKVVNEIKHTFKSIEDPYMFLLHCFNYNREIYELKSKSLSYAIVEGFKQYAEENESSLPEIPFEVQNKAYSYAKRAKPAAAKVIFGIFNFQKNKYMFIKRLKDELKFGEYSFVCNATIALKLQNEFTPFELAVPLYFLNLNNFLKELLKSCNSQVVSLLDTLDKYVGEEYNFNSILELVPCNENMKQKNVSEITKYALTVLKDYNIDHAVCPKIMHNHASKTVYYLFKKYFCLKELSTFSFCLFLRDFVQKIPSLQVGVEKLFFECDNDDVLQCFLYVMKTGPDATFQNGCIENDSEHNDRYYQLAIHKDCIYYVATLEDFEYSITKIQSCPVIGIDCEWHPTTLIGSKEELALIQMAVQDGVYLFDMCELSTILSADNWNQLGSIFSSGNTKVTYGFNSDAIVLSSINKTLAFHIKRIANHIDLHNLKEDLLLFQPSLFAYNTSNLLKGLSELVYLCFGLPLNKICQYSYWNHRPLGFNEIQYAATDAHCLIEIKNYLDGICSEMGIEDWTKLKRQQHLETAKVPRVFPYNPQPINVHQVKFVCDTMVQGLGRLLRHCGIDAKVLDTSDHHDRCVFFHEREGRIVLTRGSVYKRLIKHIPEDAVHVLQGETAKLQLNEVIKSFNIKVMEGDIFGRCADCNSGSYLCVSKQVICRMKCTGPSNDNDNEWTFVERGKVNCRKRITGCKIPIKVDDVPRGILDKQERFYICGGCGKCYWDGSHYEKVLLNMLRNLIL